MKVSVCLATFNGEKYIKAQLESILNQLEFNDELIIVDDKSSDNTLNIVNSYSDSRIKKISNEINLGVNKSFELAIIQAKNDIIFLADQDDIWTQNRVSKFKNYFILNPEISLITGNSDFINENGISITFNEIQGVRSEDSKKNISNIFDIFLGKTNYYGCTMAFRSRFIQKIYPFPTYIESHDIHIALTANILNVNLHIDDIVLYRRIHSQNNSLYKRNIFKKIKSRIIFILNIINILLNKINGKGI
jgi:glycosyltransferase involved in cell wall biosynthesis